jgi:hypothetical protein
MYPPWSLTAQTSLADGALAALIESVRPPGSLLAFQVPPCQCSAAGEPPPAPLTLAPPKTQALRAPVAVTAKKSENEPAPY